jgi:hypothetical protein
MPAKTSTPEAVTSTLCYYRDAEIISKVAGLLSENAEQKKYAALAEKNSQTHSTKGFSIPKPASMPTAARPHSPRLSSSV